MFRYTHIHFLGCLRFSCRSSSKISSSTLLLSCNECERSKLVSKKDSEKLKLLHRLHIHGSLFCSKSLYSCGVTFGYIRTLYMPPLISHFTEYSSMIPCYWFVAFATWVFSQQAQQR